MFPVVMLTVLLAAQGSDLAALAATARNAEDPAVRRAAAEGFLNERTRPCAAPQGAAVEGWPDGKDVTLTTEIFFAQPVDDEQEQELQRAVRDMMRDVLQPLGIRVADGDGTRDAAMAFTGIAQALPAMRADANVFGGTWWRGAISLDSGGKCVFSRAVERRVQPPPGPEAFLVTSPSDAPFLAGLDPALLEAMVAVAEALRGQAGLARIASSDADARACLLALGRITDQALLVGLARTAKAPWIRIPAVGKLVDVNRLGAIARTDADPDVCRAALARIAELQRKD